MFVLKIGVSVGEREFSASEIVKNDMEKLAQFL